MATKPAAKKAPAKATAAKKPATAPTVPMSKLIAELAEKHDMSKKAATELFSDFVELTAVSHTHLTLPTILSV